LDYLSLNTILSHNNIFGFTYLFGTSFKFWEYCWLPY
jgi:hypothetical protein